MEAPSQQAQSLLQWLLIVKMGLDVLHDTAMVWKEMKDYEHK